MARPTPSAPPRTLVIAALSPADQRCVAALLGSAESYDVTVTTTAAAALTHARDADAPCLLLSARLPDTDAPALLDQLRSESLDIAVIVLAEHADDPVAAEAVRRGVDDRVTCGELTPEMLRRTVAGAIERHALRRRIRDQQRAADAGRGELEAALARLAEGERLLTRIQATMAEGLMIIDAAGRIVATNPAAARILGAPREVILGCRTAAPPWKGFNLDGSPRPAWPTVADIDAGGAAVHQHEFWIERADGSRVAVSVEVTALRDDNGAFIGAVSTFRDITGRLQMEEALRRQATLLEHTYDAVLTWELDGPIVAWNRAAENLYGYTAAEAVGRRPHELLQTVHPLSAAAFEAALERTGSWSGEVVHIARDGRRLVIESRRQAMRDPLGRTLVLETNRDVTARRAAEERAAFQAEVLGRLDDAVVAVDNALRVTYWGGGAERLYGLSADQALGRPLRAVRRILWLRPGDEEAAHAALATRGSWRGEAVHITSDGRSIPVDSTVSRLTGPDGAPAGMVAIIRDVSERKRAEVALRESEERLRLAVQLTGVGTYDDHGEGATYWSPELKAIFGLPPDAVLTDGPETALLRTHPDDRELMKGAFAATHDPTGDGEVSIDHRIIRADGSVAWVSVKGKMLFDSDGRPVRALGVVHDITARKQAEERTRLLANLSELVRATHDTEALLDAVTRALGQFLGASRCLFDEVDAAADRELVRREYTDGAPPAVGEHRLTEYSAVTMRDMLAGRTVVNRDARTDPRTASLYDVTYGPTGERAYVAAPLLRGGRWVSTLWVSVGTPHDWTADEVALVETVAERTWLAVEKLRAERTLRESEARFREMADNAPVMVWVTEADGHCTYLNRLWYEITGQTPETGLGHGWLDAVHPDDRADSEAIFLGANARHEPFRLEYRLLCHDGAVRRVIDVAAPRRGQDGAFLGYIGSVTDITERWEAEEERERLHTAEQAARLEAEAALRSRDELMSFITHDLRTPLTIIRGHTQALRRQTRRGAAPDPARLDESLAGIEAGTTRMNALIQDLMDSARLQAGRPLDLAPRPTDLVALARAVVATHQQGLSHHTITLMVSEPAITGLWDTARLERVIENLLSNALKYSPNGGPITVTIDREERDGRPWATVAVRDEGIGIPATDLPRLFEPFHRAANVGRIGGTGIGLAGARQIVAQHGGDISVESAEGRGSTFTVRLPLDGQGLEVGGEGPGRDALRRPSRW